MQRHGQYRSIINFKLNNANIENFKPELYLLLPPEIDIEVPDIITILGNLLDNAIDALQHTTDNMLKLDIVCSKDSLFIKVDNAFDGNIKYSMGRGGNPDYIVSRKKCRDHGYGIKNIGSRWWKRILHVYDVSAFAILHFAVLSDGVFKVAKIAKACCSNFLLMLYLQKSTLLHLCPKLKLPSLGLWCQ